MNSQLTRRVVCRVPFASDRHSQLNQSLSRHGAGDDALVLVSEGIAGAPRAVSLAGLKSDLAAVDDSLQPGGCFQAKIM